MYLDLRDVIANKESEPELFEKWKKAIEGTGSTLEEQAENEPLMIPEYAWESYARELAEDIGAISKENQWPLYCIDWEQAARELAIDYGSVEVDGTTYYSRGF